MNTPDGKTQSEPMSDHGVCSNECAMPDPREMLMERARRLRLLADDLETLCKALPVELAQKQKLAIFRVTAEMNFRA